MSRRIVTIALLLLAAGPAAPASAKGSSGGGKAAAPPAHQQTHDEAATEYLQTLMGTRNGQSDEEAAASVRKIVGFYKDTDVTAGTKQPIPGLVTWYAKRKSKTVAVAGINGLADLGKGQGTQHLIGVLNGLLFQKDPEPDLLTAAYTGLKSVADADPAVTGQLLQMLANKDKKVVAEVVDVFAAYGAATVAERKRLVDQLLPVFESMAAVAAKAADKDAVDKWTAVAAPAAAALGALAHQQFVDVVAARKWLAEHGAEAGSWK